MAKPEQEIIASRDNRWLKRFRAALENAPAKREDCVGLEGPRLVEEAFRSGLPIEAVLVSEQGERHLTRLKPWLTREVRILRCSERMFESVAATETPQGIAALGRMPEREFEELLGAGAARGEARGEERKDLDARGRGKAGGIPRYARNDGMRGGAGAATKSETCGATGALVLVLVGVQDPGNVGTLIRSAEAFGATGAAACLGTSHPLASKALRASAGSALRLPLLTGADVASVMSRLREAKVRVYAASLDSGEAPGDADFCIPCALLIGNEAAGLPAEVARAADKRVRIPLADGVESLNAGVAGAVLLYEAARQRNAQRGAEKRSGEQ